MSGMTGPEPRALQLPAPLLDAVGGLLLAGFAAWLWVGAADIEGSGDGLMGPAGFPRAIAVLLGGTSLTMVLQAALATFGGHARAVVRVHRPIYVLLAILLVTVYPVLVTHLGYYMGTALWLAPFLFLSGMRHPLGIAATTAGFLLFTKVLFQMVLGTPLP